MRSSIADYQVLEALPPSPLGRRRYLCRAPDRFDGAEPVMVTEVAVDAGGWQQLSDLLTRLVSLSCPELVALLEVGPDLGADGSGVYLATESAPGGSLISPSDGLDRPARIRAVTRAARAVHAMHEAGLAHGAVSPATVLLTARGPALAPPHLDAPAGLASRVTAWPDLVSIDPDLLCGEGPTRESDVWSLGATLHVALTERPIYDGIVEDEPVTAVQRVLFTRPRIDPELPAPVRELISACLAPDPAARPGTAAEVAERLEGLEPGPG